MDNESNNTSPQSIEPAAQASQAKLAISRRAMLRAGASASPVLLTLASGPVSATSVVNCMVASSFVSVAEFASRNPGTTVSCSSVKADYWCEQSKLPNKDCAPLLLKKVSELLGVCSPYDNSTAKSVFAQTTSISRTGSLGVAQHCLALMLNLKSGSNYIPIPGSLSEVYLKKFWLDYNTKKPYVSPGGTTFTEDQLIVWMRVMLGYAL